MYFLNMMIRQMEVKSDKYINRDLYLKFSIIFNLIKLGIIQEVNNFIISQ